jgi:hypothetical protein
VSSTPRLAPSNLNWTPTTPTLSVAFAKTVTAVPDTVAPLAGAVIETVGGVGVVNVTVTTLVQLTVPVESVAEQVTGVLPTGKSEPDGGVHVVVTGGVAPMTSRGTRVMTTGLPSSDVAIVAWHVISNGWNTTSPL